jgi:putative ABC transport system permease protein
MKTPIPPGWTHWILTSLAPDHVAEEIEGDLYEIFVKDLETQGERKARLLYSVNAIGFLAKRFFWTKKSYSQKNVSMLSSYLIPAFRNLSRYKLQTAINVFGLSLGLTATLLAFLFVQDELAFDKIHTKAERLYRLNKINSEVDGSTSLTAETSGLMGPTMVDEFPEVEAVVRYQPWFDEIVLSYRDEKLFTAERELIFADSTFFDVFSFPLLRGDRMNVLNRPNTIVLTESVAKSLFGNIDPIGLSVVGLRGIDFEVTGIAADPPRKSHIQFKGVMSWATTAEGGRLPMSFMNNWIAQAVCTYVLLKEGASQRSVDLKFPKFMKDHLPERVDKYALYLQPFKDIYLRSQNIQALRMAKTGNIEFVYLFSIVAGFILFIACVNYINISTSKSTRRAKEVVMRKTLGAAKSQLIWRFLGESFLLTAMAGIISIFLLHFTIPFFNDLAGKSIPVNNTFNALTLGVIVTLVFVVTFASGLYPAIVITAFRPSSLLNRSSKLDLKGNWSRYTLITFQFVISIAMISSTLIVLQQIQFVLSKDLGFEKEQTLVVNLTDAMLPKGEVFQQEVNSLSNVVSTSLCRTAIGSGIPSTYVIPEGFAANEVEIRMFPVDPNFEKTYGLKIHSGRFFDTSIASDSNAIIINEALLKRLSWENALEKTIRLNEQSPAFSIVGVVKDFHFKSLYEEVEPIVMWVEPSNRRNLSIRFSGNPAPLLSALESSWRKYELRYPFQYYFVDENFAKNYESDQKLLKTIITFAALSIFIVCLGLYGLVSFTIEQRTKEFGIRRTLGASLTSLNLLVNKKFIFMILVAAFVAIPLMLPVIKKWLAKFAFTYDLGPGVFIVSIAITLIITLITVSIQAIRVARMNPTEALRQE